MQGLLLCKLPYKIPQKLVSQCNFITMCGKIAKNNRNRKNEFFWLTNGICESVTWKWPFLKQKKIGSLYY